ncbi:NHL repeat-containing protein [Desulfolithobacter sp.]
MKNATRGRQRHKQLRTFLALTGQHELRNIVPFLFLAWLLLPSALLAATEQEFQAIRYREVYRISDAFHLPSDVGVDREGRVFVLDGTSDQIRIYDRNGSHIKDLGFSNLLNQPLGLDVSSSGDVVVADSGNHRLIFYSATNKPPRIFPLPPAENGEAADCSDVSFAPDGGFVVVDNDNHRVLRLDRMGIPVWIKGVMGRNPGEFRYPFMLSTDRDGKSYVVEVINTRVQVLNPDGSFHHFIGGWGIEPGQFFRPKGIAINPDGEIFVSDSYLGVVQVFNLDGELQGIVSDASGKIIKFTTPVGLAATRKKLYVVEMYSGQVVILEKMR